MTPDSNATTPEIEAILHDLAQMCLASIQDGEPFVESRAEQLVQTLKMNGWDRHSSKQKPLRDQLRDRVFEGLQERSHPRRGELDSLVGKIQGMYNAANQFATKLPVEDRRGGQEPRDQAAPPRTTLQGEK